MKQKRARLRRSAFMTLSICAIAICLTAGFLSGCKPETNSTPIRIATNPWPGYEFLHLAEKKGFLKEEGANIKLVRFSALEDVRRAYETKQVDGMCSTIVELVQAYKHGRASQIVIASDFSNGSDVVMARKGIQDITDLKGKIVGLESESLNVFVIARVLEKAGLSLDDIQIKIMSQINIPEAMLSGKIDAAHIYPPYSTELAKHPDQINQIFDSSQIPGEIIDIVALDPDIIKARPDDIRALRRAWDRAIDYAATHPEESNALMGEIEGISTQEFSETMKGIKILRIADYDAIATPGGTLEKTIAFADGVLNRHDGEERPFNPTDFIYHEK